MAPSFVTIRARRNRPETSLTWFTIANRMRPFTDDFIHGIESRNGSSGFIPEDCASKFQNWSQNAS
jgi:hypothetical protein